MDLRIVSAALALILALPAVAEEPVAGPQPIPLPPKTETLQVPAAEPPAAPPATAQPAPAPAPPPAAAPVSTQVLSAPVAVPVVVEAGLPGWAAALLVPLGAFAAGMVGVAAVGVLQRRERAERRRAAATALSVELNARRQAFDAVPVPPNAEAGVTFVSAVWALAGFNAAFRASQASLHLLPDKMAAHLCLHYAAVERVAAVVKGQSMAAAVRMLQANRLGGQPCPDAGALREAHVELTFAFRGIDKMVETLERIR